MVDYKNILTGVAERLSSLREERPSAGTRYRLMGTVEQGTGTCSNLKKIVIWLAYQKNVVYLHRIC